MEQTQKEAEAQDSLLQFESRYKRLSGEQLAQEAVNVATRQIMASFDFKKPRIARLQKYWDLYDGKVPKKLRQLFNVPIPVFPGMVDTLNALYDTPILLKFKEGDPSDYFKVLKIEGAYRREVVDTAENSKWDQKLTLARSHAIMEGRAIIEYSATSYPEYTSDLSVIKLQDFNFQPNGGGMLENHLFAGTEDIEKTASELIKGAREGYYNKEQVKLLLSRSGNSEYLPFSTNTSAEKLNRFKALGLNAEDHSYVGEQVFKLSNHIVNIDGQRYYLCFNPWTLTWLRFEKWTENNGLYPWVSFATHYSDSNFASKSFADDLYPAADAIVAMFNQELTNREKRNFAARAYDKDVFKDVRKLDDSMHRPDALVPADTQNGTRRISEAVYEFKVGELGGTVSLIDWISGTLGRNTGATELSQGGVSEVSKKASVTFAEQKSVSKRISWSSKPFQGMMADLGKRFIYGLKNHMPAKMAIRIMGEGGWDWDEITRLDLDTKKDIDVLIVSTDAEVQNSEIKAARREKALAMVANSQNVNSKKKDEEILKSVGDYSDEEVAEFMDVKTYSDRKSLARASVAIEMILRDEKPELWYGATIAFVQKITDYAADKRATLKGKFKTLVDYAMAHTDIVRENIERKVAEESMMMQTMADPMQLKGGSIPMDKSEADNPGMSGGMSRAMNIAESAV